MDKYKITAGIFISLLGEFRYQESRSKRMDSENLTNITYPMLYTYLTKIIGGKYVIDNPTSKTVTAFKKCAGQGGTIKVAINESACSAYFTEQIENNYDLLLLRTSKMLKDCIQNDKKARLLFVKRIFYVLENSTSFSDKKFYYHPSTSKTITKEKLLKLKRYDFPALVLALWHASISYISNNKLGTFDALFTKVDSKQEFLFKEGLDKLLPTDIDIYNELSPEEPIIIPEDIKKEPQIEEPEVHETQDEENVEIIDNKSSDNQNTKSVNPRVIILNGSNAKYFENVGVLNLKDDD